MTRGNTYLRATTFDSDGSVYPLMSSKGKVKRRSRGSGVVASVRRITCVALLSQPSRTCPAYARSLT